MFTMGNSVDSKRWENDCQQQGVDGWFFTTYGYIGYGQGPYYTPRSSIGGVCVA